ncbi:MAG: formylmethanofuran dehydrogenase subunit C [Methanotrichaceae archaeon]
MRKITIKPLQRFEVPIEAEKICPDVFANLNLKEIETLEVWEGNRKRILSDLFQISGDDGSGSPEETLIKLEGDFSRVKRIGEKMTAGAIEANGDVGMHAGNKMKGGSLHIKGNACEWLGREMRGGKILVKGDAGGYAGSGYRGEICGMCGGEIQIEGSAGDYLGEHICGGTINVGGDGGDFAGASNNGGSITIGGNAYLPGAEMASGSIVVKGKTRVLPSYQFQGIVGLEGLTLKKFVGDLTDNGKGNLYTASVENDSQLGK